MLRRAAEYIWGERDRNRREDLMDEPKRKFHNPTPGYVGAVVLDDDNKPKGMPVEPGGFIWLSPVEERLTAEAPRLAEDNPFVKGWRDVTATGPDGAPTEWVDRKGVLVMSEEPARTIMSERHIPSQAESGEDAGAGQDDEPEPEITGAPPIPQQPPVEGQPAPDEHVATPEAVAQNDEFLARRAAEQAAASGDAEEEDAEAGEKDDGGPELTGDEGPTAVGEDGPKGKEQIGVQKGALV